MNNIKKIEIPEDKLGIKRQLRAAITAACSYGFHTKIVSGLNQVYLIPAHEYERIMKMYEQAFHQRVSPRTTVEADKPTSGGSQADSELDRNAWSTIVNHAMPSIMEEMHALAENDEDRPIYERALKILSDLDQ